MCRAHLLLRHRASDLLHFADVIDGIHLLHMSRVNLWKTQEIQPFSRQLGVITRIGEQLRDAGICRDQ